MTFTPPSINPCPFPASSLYPPPSYNLHPFAPAYPTSPAAPLSRLFCRSHPGRRRPAGRGVRLELRAHSQLFSQQAGLHTAGVGLHTAGVGLHTAGVRLHTTGVGLHTAGRSLLSAAVMSSAVTCPLGGGDVLGSDVSSGSEGADATIATLIASALCSCAVLMQTITAGLHMHIRRQACRGWRSSQFDWI